MYVSTSEVYGATSLTSSEITEANVTSFIKSAEREVDRITLTTYWNVEDSGTAESGSASTIQDTNKSWDTNAYEGEYVWIHSGTGSGQVREIDSNDGDTLTIERDWDTNPDNTSVYKIVHTGTDPYVNNSFDGTGIETFFVERYPIRIIESLSIDSTSVTLSKLYRYDNVGEIQLKNNAEVKYFKNGYPQQVELAYWYGVYKIPEEVKRFVIVSASLKTLRAQMGGTHNVPSSYNLPEGSVTIGQAYVNIKGTHDVLQKEYNELKQTLIKYPFIYTGY